MSSALEKPLLTELLSTFAEIISIYIKFTIYIKSCYCVLCSMKTVFYVIILLWAYTFGCNSYWFSQLGTGTRLYKEVLCYYWWEMNCFLLHLSYNHPLKHPSATTPAHTSQCRRILFWIIFYLLTIIPVTQEQKRIKSERL